MGNQHVVVMDSEGYPLRFAQGFAQGFASRPMNTASTPTTESLVCTPSGRVRNCGTIGSKTMGLRAETLGSYICGPQARSRACRQEREAFATVP